MIKLERILVPTDFSDCSVEAAKYACALAEQFNAELSVLHVIHDYATEIPDFGMGLTFPAYLEKLPERLEKLEEDAIGRLTQVLDPAWEVGKRVTLATKLGHPFTEILRFVKEHQIDMIVMGTHGRTALPQMLMGSVAEKVVRKASCPVLTVRPDGHQFVMP